MVFSVQNQCSLDNNIISVERIKQFMTLPREAPPIIESNRPPSFWPSHGNVELQNLQVRGLVVDNSLPATVNICASRATEADVVYLFWGGESVPWNFKKTMNCSWALYINSYFGGLVHF